MWFTRFLYQIHSVSVLVTIITSTVARPIISPQFVKKTKSFVLIEYALNNCIEYLKISTFILYLHLIPKKEHVEMFYYGKIILRHDMSYRYPSMIYEVVNETSGL